MTQISDEILAEFDAAYLKAWQDVLPKPLIADRVGDGTDLAYKIQASQVRHRLRVTGDTIRGYKAGLTSDAAQAAMGLDQPAAGVLYSTAQFPPGARIDLGKYVRPLLEVELGYQLAEEIKSPLSLDNCLDVVADIHMMIELADSGFAGRPTAADLIAGNVASAAHIAGERCVPDDINGVKVALHHEGRELFSGRSSDALGDQRAAFCWLVNRILTLGYDLPRGCLLMTGSLGSPAPASKGHYRAIFEGLGQLEFDLV